MNEMRSRVARLLSSFKGTDHDGHARAVFAAMREPTKEMLGATFDVCQSMSKEDVVGRHEALPNRVVWQAMIDEALK